MLTETTVKLICLGLAGVTGTSILAAGESVQGIESHMTFATAAVCSTVTLFAALRWTVAEILKAKNSQIDALREREKIERKRADEAEARLREHLERFTSEPHK